MANNFSISDPNTDKRITNALNRSFDSIQTLVDNYEPVRTEQNFAILNYDGYVEKDKSLTLSVKADVNTPIFCFYGSQYKFIGTLVGDKLTFTETIEDSEHNKIKVVIYQPFRTAVSRNPVQLTKDSFYKSKSEIQTK